MKISDELKTALVSFLVLIALASIGCAKDQGHDLQFHGDATVFYKSSRAGFKNTPAIENSMVVRDGSVLAFFDPAAVGSMLMADLGPDGTDFKSQQTILTHGARFSYVFFHSGKFWNFVTNGDVYLYSSDDGLQWRAENNGAPVMHAVPNTPYAVLWNVGVDISADGTWHLLVEASDGTTPGQEGVGLGYSTATMTTGLINFDTNKSAQHVIPHGGNPFVKALSDGRLFVVHGQAYDPSWDFGAEWYTTASTIHNGQVTRHPNFALGVRGEHVCDPHMVDLPSGGSMLTVSVAQNSISLAHSNLTIEEIANKLGGQ